MIENSLIKKASFTPKSLQHPNAWVGHLPFAAWVIQEISPKIFVELGTHSGNSYFSFCQSVVETGLLTKCYAVDTWQGDEHAGQYGDGIFSQVNAYHQKHYEGFSRLLRTTFDDAVTYFADESIDLLHIDGLHTYEAVRHDFETWLPKLAPGAVVMFHDTNVRERNFGVWKFWEELQALYPNNLEFVHSHGLGVLQLNIPPENSKLKWLQPDSSEKQLLISYFAALGSRQLERFELIELNQHANSLNQAIADRDGKVASLTQAVSERDGQIVTLSQAMTERDGQIATLSQAVSERDGQIATLSQAMTERDGQIASLSQEVHEREALVQTIVGSESWRITQPMRWVGSVLRGVLVTAMDPIKKKALHPSNPAEPSFPAADCGNLAPTCSSFVFPLPIKPTHPVAVILPVYRDIEMTKRCIVSAIPGIQAVQGARLIAINDASPEAGMQEMLEELASQWPCTLEVLKNEINLGFVGTVNRGFAYYPKHDVVLLNSDVLVPLDWLPRLIDEAYSRSDIGTVTPLSNNATICSFPYFLQENNQPFNLDVNLIDAAFKYPKLPCVTSPTGVGFCMYIRRACLDETGYLNQEKFGRGYGEENDLCQRAIKYGWLNVVSPNIYAYHEGGVSFSSEKQSLVKRAMQVIDELHPEYHAKVQTFIAEDPLKLVRIERYIRLLAITAIPKVIHISHKLGGGVAQHIEELAQHFSIQAAHILLTPYGEDGAITISFGVSAHADKLIFLIPSQYGDLIELLETMGVSAVHIHHTAGIKSEILNLPHDLGVPHLITAHDYYLMSGNPTLTDENGIYPGFYSDKLHNPSYPPTPEMTSEKWQAQYRPLIDSAAFVIFPSYATKALFEHVYKIPNAVVAPHVEGRLNVNRKPSDFTKKHTYTIGALGAIGREKGADLLEELAERSNILNSPLKFKLIGYAYKSLSSVTTTGAYKVQDLQDLIQSNSLDLILFPAQCPETYSYTLSYALDSGLPIIAPNIGAFPERLSGRANSLLFNHLASASEILEQISSFIIELSNGVPINLPIFEEGTLMHNFYASDYLSIVSQNVHVFNNNEIVMPNLEESMELRDVKCS